ncbi:Dihydrolipoamide acetyltransferase, partial [Salmonella enterica subsp. enterica serovar Inverness str. R8-3668]
SLIMVFEVAGEAGAAAPAKAEAAPAAAAPAAATGVKDVNVPDIGGDEVEVTEVMVKVGDKVAAEQSLITVEGDKASMEVPAPFAGTVKEIKISTGDKVDNAPYHPTVADHRRRRQSLYGSPVSAGWRRERDQSLCRRQNRDWCTYHDFRFRRRCS